MAKAKKITAPLSSEEKIKEAARTVFMKKGYAATRTRDIAEEAGINLALLNYYFRSKEKLFEIVMQEKFFTFFSEMIPAMFDTTTTLDRKIEKLADGYISMLCQNPDLPLFVLGEIRSNPEKFAKNISNAEMLRNSVFTKQLMEKNAAVDPDHFFMNIMGFCIFPFIMRPAYQAISRKDHHQFIAMMEERKKLIPAWTKAMLKVK